MQRIARFGTLLAILAFVCAGPAAAQNTSGAISGTITDTQGGVLPGGFSQQLMADTAINIDGVVQHTSNLPVTTNVNQPITTTSPRPLPEWGQINMVKTIGGYDYKALLVRLAVQCPRRRRSEQRRIDDDRLRPRHAPRDGQS